MNAKKQYYQLKYQLSQTNERQRIVITIAAVLLILLLWFLVFFYQAMGLYKNTNLKSRELQIQTTNFSQKRAIIDSVLQYRTTTSLLRRYDDLQNKINNMHLELTKYNEHYISKRQLSKLLHDILKQTMGVKILDFTTVAKQKPASTGVSPASPVNQQKSSVSPASPVNQQKSLLRGKHLVSSTHYRLTLSGNYFSIMNYLKRIEQIPWNLYWDTFDYEVKKYPDAVATVEFYTLKPKSEK